MDLDRREAAGWEAGELLTAGPDPAGHDATVPDDAGHDDASHDDASHDDASHDGANRETAGRVTTLLWGPVVVVTAAQGGQRSGQIAISGIAASTVAGRPRLLVSLWKLNLTHDLVARSGALALHTLRDDQVDLIRHFGLQTGRSVDKFAGLGWAAGTTGSPILADCLGWVEGRVINALDGGDMTTFLIDVIRGDVIGRPENLLTWPGIRDRLAADLLAEIEAKRQRDLPWNLAHLDQITQPFLTPATGAQSADEPGC